MGGCCSKQNVTVYDEFPEDCPNLQAGYDEQPWEYKILATDIATIRMGKSGLAADTPFTVARCFEEAAAKWPNKIAYAVEPEFADKKGFDNIEEANSASRDTWKTWTWQEAFTNSKNLAKSALSLGLETGDGIGIWGFNSPYWVMASMSGIFSGGVSMGIYPTDTPEIVAYKIKHCSCRVVFVESAKHQATVEKLYKEGQLHVGPKGETFVKLQAIVVWGKSQKAETDIPVYTWDQYLELAGKVDDKTLDEAMDQHPGKVVSYCYTSGTTGLPKAVMLTNDNLTWNCRSTLATSANCVPLPEEVRTVSYLPLSHIAATLLDMIGPLLVTSGRMKEEHHQNSYWSVYFVRPYDLKKGTLKQRLCCVRPIIFLAVPRVWEKMEFAIRQLAKTGCVGAIIGSLKAKLLANAKAIEMGGDGSVACCSCLANVIGNGIKAKVGLDESLFNITGAAPIRSSTVDYFASIGIQIYELYGMSEMAATSTTNKIGASRAGSIGGQMDGQEVGIFNSDGTKITKRFTWGQEVPEDCQGEVRTRGRNLMMGYLGNPDLGEEHMATILQKNQETITKDGWICSGDKGACSTEGLYKITGRYKELIITAGGENVAPIPLENNVKVNTTIVSNIMMFGDKMPYNCALITVRCVDYTGFEVGSNKLDRVIYKKVIADGKMQEPDCKTLEELISKDESHPIIKEIIDTIVATNSTNTVCPSNASRIQKFMILPEDFAVENGMLTPTLKLKRSVVSKKYKEAIDQIYAAPRKALYVRYQDPPTGV